jgi:hypothetical protein
MSEDLKRYLFLEKILTLSPSTLTQTGFTLVEHYMTRVNDKAGFIRFDQGLSLCVIVVLALIVCILE